MQDKKEYILKKLDIPAGILKKEDDKFNEVANWAEYVCSWANNISKKIEAEKETRIKNDKRNNLMVLAALMVSIASFLVVLSLFILMSI